MIVPLSITSTKGIPREIIIIILSNIKISQTRVSCRDEYLALEVKL